MNKSFILLACISLSIIGCKDENTNNNRTHAHAHIDPLSYTVYTDKTELFVEFNPLIIGKTTKFAAHFTKLGNNFIAVEEGSVSLKLVGKKDQPSYKAGSISSPGIFRLSLKPINTGKFDLVFILQAKEFSDTIIIENISVYPNEELSLKDVQESLNGEEIGYLKEQAWKVEFSNKKVLKQPFTEIIKTTGHILPAQGDEVIITAKSDGIITFGNNKKLGGSSVKSGETLFIISGRDLVENNIDKDYLDAKAALKKNKTDFERAEKLIKERIISVKEFQEVELRFQKAQIEFNTISKNYSTNGKKITSPLAGFIKNILVNEGEYVELGQPIASVSQNRRLVLKAEVPQKHYTKLNSMASANFKTVYDDIVYDIDSLNGQFISFGKSTDEHAYYIPVNFEIDNKAGIIPGSFIEVYLKANKIKNTLIIPLTALMEEYGNYYTYVQTSGEGFQKRELKLGASDGINVQVLSGIKENERVVTKGAYHIKLSTMSGKMPAHGHEH
jgi:cobalt-zinc-cadmium efflux system membrane fusion protein